MHAPAALQLWPRQVAPALVVPTSGQQAAPAGLTTSTQASCPSTQRVRVQPNGSSPASAVAQDWPSAVRVAPLVLGLPAWHTIPS